MLRRVSAYYMGAFTLLEVVTVILISGALLLLSMPRMRDIFDSRLRQETNMVAALIERTIVDSQSGERNIVLAVTDTELIVRDAKQRTVVLERHHLAYPVKFAVPGPNGAIIRLHSGEVASPATLKLVSHQKSCLIKLSLRGRVRTECE